MRLVLGSVLVLSAALAFAFVARKEVSSTGLEPAASTASVANDPDDPAIWINRTNPDRSLVIGTNKVAVPDGALYVFGLDGAVRQIVKPLDRPNNVDVEYGLPTPGGPIDIVVATERLQNRLRVYRVTEEGLTPVDGGGLRVLQGESGEAAAPMGLSLYRRPGDGAIFAIVSPKAGGTTNHLWQYKLAFDAVANAVRATLVRRFGSFSGTGEIEAIAVDDALGYVYFADEEFGIRKWHADPDHPDAGRELAVFGRNGFTRQREGIAIIETGEGTGFVIGNDQIPGGSVLHVYRREGQAGRPNEHEPAVLVVPTRADSTDGIEATATGLGPRFPGGMLAMMNSSSRNFQLYDLRDLRKLIAPPK